MMNTRPIPVSGEALPVIGCGTWLGFDVGGQPAEQPQRGQVLAELFAHGGRVVDSSPMYGSADQVAGRLLAKAGMRSQAFIATKVWTHGKKAGLQQMERSFELLQTEVIDLMQVHNLVDWQTHLPLLRQWKAQGRIRYLGITHYTESAHGELEQVMKAETWDFVQLNYSVAHRAVERRLLPLAQERGIAVLANLPLDSGKLLKQLDKRALPGWATELGCTGWSQVLLKFVLAHPAVTCAIPGTGSPAHMRDNALAGHGELPPPAFWRDKLDALLQP